MEGLSSDQIGTAAFEAGLALLELAPQGASLEEAYMALTAQAVDFRAGEAAAAREEVAA